MNAPPTAPVTIDKRIEQYVKLRDIIKEKDEAHKEEMRPFREALEELGLLLLKHLQDSRQNSASTEFGTVYRTVKKSATIQDGAAFWRFVTENNLYDLLDRKANVTAIADYIEEHSVTPPGINYSLRQEIGVRRK